MARDSSTTQAPALDGILWRLHNDKATPKGQDKAMAPASGSSKRSLWMTKLNVVSLFRSLKKNKDSVGPKLPKPVRMASTAPKAIYALVIGINEYRTVEKLQGASEDADAFSRYLQNDLNVLPANVCNLRNQQASRSEIVDTLTNISKNDSIQSGDPIIVYFAGRVTSSSKGIPGLVPSDAKSLVDSVTGDDILPLIMEIRQRKGENLTIVLDGRGSDPTPNASGIRETIGKSKTPVKPSDFPLVITGFSPGEIGGEDGGKGRFTTALLKMLRRNGSAPILLSDGLNRISQLVGQTPQCPSQPETEKALFDMDKTPANQTRYPVAYTNDKVVVQTGSVNGVTHGTHFSIYRREEDIASGPAMACVAEDIQPFSSTLKPSNGPVSSLAKSAFAIISCAGLPYDLVLCTQPDDSFKVVNETALGLLGQSTSGSHRILLTQNTGIADLGLSILPDNKVRIDVLDERAAVHGFKFLPIPLPIQPSSISRFITSAARYYRYLNQTHLSNSIGNSITVDLLMLEESDTEFDDLGFAVLNPVSDNLFKQGVAHLSVNSEDQDSPVTYGFKITNNTAFDLYPHVFYFDNSDFSIGNYYPKNDPVEIIRKQGGTMTIGYDHTEASPFAYYLREGQDLDVGFLKLMFTTEPMDLQGDMAQGSAFEGGPDPGEGDDNADDIQPTSSRQIDRVWGSMLCAIVQHRADPGATDG